MKPTNETTDIHNKETLALFLEQLSQKLARGEVDWKNIDMVQFIEAMSAWIADMDGYYKNMYSRQCPEQPSWRMLADIIIASSQYE